MVSISSAIRGKLTRRKLLPAIAIMAGIALLCFAGSGLWQRYRTTHARADMPDATRIVGQDVDTPTETAPPSSADYRVAADQPRSIDLPSIGAQGFIQKVGLDKQGAVVAPTNIAFAGWYALGAKPGDKGVSLIDGHVQGHYNPGVFKRLAELKPGDRFSVEFGDHSRRQFEVVRVASYPVAEAGKRMLQHDPSIERQLNLITCDGRYDRAAHRYVDRALVTSKAL